MSSDAKSAASWSRPRWVVVILLVFGLHVAFVGFLSDPTPMQTRRPRPGPALALVANLPGEQPGRESLAVDDPTLYALANQHGFSGPIWWDLLHPTLQLPDWAEPARWLQPRLETLGATFLAFVRADASAAPTLAEKPPAELAQIPLSETLLSTQSTLEIEGDLVQRPLRESLKLPAWPENGFLTNTLVQVAIDAAGVPVSVILLEHSRSKAADQRALELAREARFEPLPGHGPDRMSPTGSRTWGTLIFHWQIEPVSTGRTPAPKP